MPGKYQARKNILQFAGKPWPNELCTFSISISMAAASSRRGAVVINPPG